MGPDLARAGVPGGPMYKDSYWHYKHMLKPQDVNENSVMPAYPWLISDQIDYDIMPAKIRAMQTLVVPYPEGYDEQAVADMKKQGDKIAAELAEKGANVTGDREIIAMIAYLHRLGFDISQNKTASN
jgi:cytochrome c oxidase cbb3-type subunit I/II